MLKIFALIVAVLAAVFIAPMAASAVPYTPGAAIHASKISLSPGETVTIYADAGFFAPGETVTITLTGIDGRSATFPATVSATATGATSFVLTMPADASGSYTVSLTSASASGSVVLDVLSNASPSNPTNPSDPGSSGTSGASGSTLTTAGLAFTGFGWPGALIWAAAGMLGLGIAFVIVRAMKRREKLAPR